MKRETSIIHGEYDPTKHRGTVSCPVHRTSTVLFNTIEEYQEAEKGKAVYPDTVIDAAAPDYSYGISGTPTNQVLQSEIATIDNAKHCLLYPSGLSAIASVCYSFLKTGDHVLMMDNAYGPGRRFCKQELSRFGVETSFYDPTDVESAKALIKDNTKLMFLESPGSLTFEIQDIPAFTQLAKAHNIRTVLDNSWATCIYLDPFIHGVDLCLQAGTKYLNGHSDVLLGTITTNNTDDYKQLYRHFRNAGLHVSPDLCSLALRGLKTMVTRLRHHEKATLQVAKYLENHPQISAVLHPALPSHPQHDLWKRDFTGSTGLFSIVLDQKYSAKSIAGMVNNLDYFGIGASWGGFESLVMPFDPISIRTATKWPHEGSCIRLYCGLEHPEDLIKDLEAGLKRL